MTSNRKQGTSLRQFGRRFTPKQETNTIRDTMYLTQSGHFTIIHTPASLPTETWHQ